MKLSKKGTNVVPNMLSLLFVSLVYITCLKSCLYTCLEVSKIVDFIDFFGVLGTANVPQGTNDVLRGTSVVPRGTNVVPRGTSVVLGGTNTTLTIVPHDTII